MRTLVRIRLALLSVQALGVGALIDLSIQSPPQNDKFILNIAIGLQLLLLYLMNLTTMQAIDLFAKDKVIEKTIEVKPWRW